MAYSFDIRDNSLVLNGVEAGIAPSPYAGISNIQNANITTIPGEASVGFATESVMKAPVYTAVTVTSNGVSNDFIIPQASAPALETGQAVFFTNIGISGVSGTTIYYTQSVSIGSTNVEFSLSPQYSLSGSGLSTGTTGTMTMYVIPLTLGPRGSINKNYQVESPNFDFIASPNHWLADSNGLVWSDIVKTGTTNSWTYTGNVGDIANFGGTTDTTARGQGFTYLQTTPSTAGNGFDGWLFLWRQGQIDYLKVISGNFAVASTSLSWQYAWKTNLVAGTSFYPSGYVLSHEAIITPGNYVAFCDGFTMGLFYQESSATAFNPTNGSTYAYFGGASTGYPILAADDIAQCCTYTGSYLYVGGQKNVIYPWDLSSSQPTNPLITLPERDVKNLIGVNQKIYIFAGSRGRIYISQGSQADLFAKIPDHISTSVQPILAWGAAIYSLNQLYFGLFQLSPGTTSAISNDNVYGGVWGIDVDSQVLYMQNTLSDGYNSSYCCLLAPMNNAEMVGYGLYAGSYNSAHSISVVDVSLSTPYTAGQTIIDFDLIPIGSFNLPRTNTWVEYKLSVPMVAGESIALYSRNSWNATWNLIATDSTVGNFSNSYSANWNNAQWLQMRAVLTSTGTTPSYVRLKELRIGGNTGPSFGQQSVLTI